MYSKQDIDSIRSKIDIVLFLEERGVTLRQTGTSFIGLCPLHNERSPSFHVRPASNTFHCFGCSEQGDIFTLVQQMDSLSFTGSVQELAEYAGVELEQVEQDENFKARQRLSRICDIAAVWFRQNWLTLTDDHPAKQDLAKRDLLFPNDNPTNFAAYTDKTIGWAPERGLIGLLRSQGFTEEEIATAGLAKKYEDSNKYSELFRNRLIWTLTDAQGKPIGFSGRRVLEDDKGPKYLNSPQTPLFNKSKTLLNLSRAKKDIVKTQSVYIVEGNADVLAVMAAGHNNVVASCGTAFGTEHANILMRLSATGREAEKFRMIFCFDGDAAGIKAAKKVFEENKALQLNSYVVKIAPGQGDPCDVRLREGNEGLTNLLEKTQVSIVEFILQEELQNYNISSPEGQAGYIKKAKEVLSLITDPIQYGFYVRKVSFWTGLSYASLNEMMRPAKPGTARLEVNKTMALNMEQILLAAALQYPEEIKRRVTANKITLDMFAAEPELSTRIFSGEELDYNEEKISRLLHHDLKINEKRQSDVFDNIIKGFQREAYTRDLNRLNASLATKGEEDETMLLTILQERNVLKQKYAMK